MLSVAARPERPRRNFTALANAWVRDARASWAARGMLPWLASHKIGYRFTEDEIVAAGPSGRDVVRGLLAELVELGYLVRRRARDVAGRITGVVLELLDPFASACIPGVGADLGEPEKPQVNPSPESQAEASIYLSEDQLQEQQLLPETGVSALSSTEGSAMRSAKQPALFDAVTTTSEMRSPDGTLCTVRATTVEVAGEVVTAEVVGPRLAGHLVQDWTDHCARNGVILPSRIVGRYAKQIGEMYADQIPELLVKSALQSMLEDGVAHRPELLAARIVSVQTGPEIRRTRYVDHRQQQRDDVMAYAMRRDAEDAARAATMGLSA